MGISASLNINSKNNYSASSGSVNLSGVGSNLSSMPKTNNPTYNYEEIDYSVQESNIKNDSDSILSGLKKVYDYTATTIASVGWGAMELVEMAGDAVLLAGGALAAGAVYLFGGDNDGVQDWTKNKIAYDWTEAGYQAKMQELGVDENIANGAVHQVASTAGTMVAFTAATIVSGGTAAVALGATTAAGSAAEMAYKSGASFNEGLVCGAAAGVVGGISGGLLNKVGASAGTVTTAKQGAAKMIEGAAVAAMEPITNSATQYVTYADDGSASFKDYYIESGGLLNTLIAAGIGAGSTGYQFAKSFKANKPNTPNNFENISNVDVDNTPELTIDEVRSNLEASEIKYNNLKSELDNDAAYQWYKEARSKGYAKDLSRAEEFEFYENKLNNYKSDYLELNKKYNSMLQQNDASTSEHIIKETTAPKNMVDLENELENKMSEFNKLYGESNDNVKANFKELKAGRTVGYFGEQGNIDQKQVQKLIKLESEIEKTSNLINQAETMRLSDSIGADIYTSGTTIPEKLLESKVYSPEIEAIKSRYMEAFNLDYNDLNDRAIVNSLMDMLEENNFGSENVKKIFENLDKVSNVKKIQIGAWDSSSGYWDPRNTLGMNLNDLNNPKFVFSHEAGHMIENVFLDTTDKGITLSDDIIKALDGANENVLKNMPEINTRLDSDMIQYKKVVSEAFDKYDIIRPEREKYIDSLIEEIQANKSTLDISTRTIIHKSLDNTEIQDILKTAGIENATVDTLLEDKTVLKNVLLKQDEINYVSNYKTREYSDFNKLGTNRKFSSIINTITRSNSDLHTTFGHTFEYFNEHSVFDSHSIQFDELFADYCSIMTSGRSDLISDLRKYAGDEVFDMLEGVAADIVTKMMG